jgi:hypothetical protein
MKKIVPILIFIFIAVSGVFAQDNEQENQEGGKLQQRLNQYLQKRLGLSKNEAEKFSPVYLRYFNELRKAHVETRNLPPIDRQQKIVEIRLRYRNEFKPILGEERANKVFVAEQEFRKKAQDLLENRKERLQNRGNKKSGALLQ